MENKILLEIESLMLADNFLKAEQLIKSHSSELTGDKDFSFFKAYVKYLKTFDINYFGKVTGFSDANREYFFKHIHNFPIRPIDNKAFIKIISKFFSNQTIEVYKSYCDVYQNSYKKQTYDATYYPEVCHKYILDGDLERGWKTKILMIQSKIPPFVDTSKFCQPPSTQHSTILVTPEQGFGDNIFYFRMWLQFCENNQSTKIIFIAKDELFELFKESNTCNNLVVYSLHKEYELYSKLDFDFFCFDYFAPLYLHLKNNDISDYPRLKNEEVPEKSIGIFWCTEIRTDSRIRLKNVPLSIFWKSLNIDKYQTNGYAIHSLQSKHSREDLDFLLKKNVKIHELKNFKETSNIIKKCEKIFSIDTGVLHLSQALGKNTTCVFNYYKGFHYDKKNGLYPSIKRINLCNQVFKHFNHKLNNYMKLLIATPAYGGQVYSRYTESLVYTCFFLKMNNIDFELKYINNQLVTRARNMCSSIFLEDKTFTHMMFIDSDVAWQPQDIKKLLDHNKECVIGVYPNKEYFWKDGKLLVSPSSVISKDNETTSGLVKVKYGAAGFMLLSRNALERIKDKVETFFLPGSNGEQIELHNFFDCRVVDHDYLTEDYYFSHLFNESGGEIYADTSIYLTHLGTHEYGSILK